MFACCGASEHQWDRYNVLRDWFPDSLRCLIIGENPGRPEEGPREDAAGQRRSRARSRRPSQYFYREPASYDDDRVAVRRALLRGLYGEGLIRDATLPGFRDAGFLFDHAIRCLLRKEDVKREHRAAQRYGSRRVEHPDHLRPLIAQSRVVWVMGYLASNAVANIADEFPKERRLISRAPWPGEVAPGSRFFLSEYFTRWNEDETNSICQAFSRFARGRGIFNESASSQ